MATTKKAKRLPGQKSAVKRRTDIARPFCGGLWTEARMVSFIKSALRGARWPEKYYCIAEAYVEDGINPKTGRRCKLHRCPECQDLFPATGMQADHIEPVVGPEGFTTWDDFIARLYCPREGFVALCKGCHKAKTKEENTLRRELKKENGSTNIPRLPAPGREATRKVFAPSQPDKRQNQS